MTVDEITKELNLQGWLVLNLHQYANNHWVCKLQKKTANGSTLNEFTEISEGKTMLEALRAAHANAKAKRNAAVAVKPSNPGTKATASLDSLTQPQRARINHSFQRMLDAVDAFGSR